MTLFFSCEGKRGQPVRGKRSAGKTKARLPRQGRNGTESRSAVALMHADGVLVQVRTMRGAIQVQRAPAFRQLMHLDVSSQGDNSIRQLKTNKKNNTQPVLVTMEGKSSGNLAGKRKKKVDHGTSGTRSPSGGNNLHLSAAGGLLRCRKDRTQESEPLIIKI